MKSSFWVMQDIIRMETVGELNKIRGKVLFDYVRAATDSELALAVRYYLTTLEPPETLNSHSRQGTICNNARFPRVNPIRFADWREFES